MKKVNGLFSGVMNNEGPYHLFTSNRPEKKARSDLQLSERLASLGIMGDQLRATLKPPVHHRAIVLRGLRGALHWFLHYAERRQSNVKFSSLSVESFWIFFFFAAERQRSQGA